MFKLPPGSLLAVELLLQGADVEGWKWDAEVLAFLLELLYRLLQGLPFYSPLLHLFRGFLRRLQGKLVHALGLECLPPCLELLQRRHRLRTLPLNVFTNHIPLFFNHVSEGVQVTFEVFPLPLDRRQI